MDTSQLTETTYCATTFEDGRDAVCLALHDAPEPSMPLKNVTVDFGVPFRSFCWAIKYSFESAGLWTIINPTSWKIEDHIVEWGAPDDALRVWCDRAAVKIVRYITEANPPTS